jgi:hypothetical protein
MAVEALSLLPWYEELFDDAHREAARQRLEQYRFNVEEFLRSASPPDWARSAED